MTSSDEFRMAETRTANAPESADGPLHVRADRPVDVRFSFEQRQSRVGAAASVGAHVVLLIIGVIVARYAPERPPMEMAPVVPVDRIVWIAEPGPGGGGGGGGNLRREPPRTAELPGRDRITVPVEKRPDPTPPPKVEEPEEPPPLEAMNLPAMNMAAGQQALPGTIQSGNVASESQGSGTGGGAGTGSVPGSAAAPARGWGRARRRSAAAPIDPVPASRCRVSCASQAADGRRHAGQGPGLRLAGVHRHARRVGRRSPGDQVARPDLRPRPEAIKAARQWRFSPGLREGQPVPVIITIELTFTLRRGGGPTPDEDNARHACRSPSGPAGRAAGVWRGVRGRGRQPVSRVISPAELRSGRPDPSSRSPRVHTGPDPQRRCAAREHRPGRPVVAASRRGGHGSRAAAGRGAAADFAEGSPRRAALYQLTWQHGQVLL